MIKFERDGAIVKVKINTGVGHEITTEYNCSNALYATLLRQQLADNYWKSIEQVRRESYEQGYKDRRQKKQKERLVSRHIKFLRIIFKGISKGKNYKK